MIRSTRSVAVLGAAVAVVIGLNAWHWYRETTGAGDDAATRAASRPASPAPELLPEMPDPTPQPGVSSSGEPGEAQFPATIDTEAQDALPRSEYRAVPMPAPTADVPPDAGDDWLRAFQEEERDEAWAAPLETEIRKSLEPEINLGRFYLVNAECRATLCEIRLLARGSLQRAELDQFQSTIYTLPWAAHLNPALSSGADSGDGYESIWIFERRPESPAAN